MACFLLITPLAAISGWLCLRGAQDHLQLKSRLEAVGLIALTIALFTIYILWTLVTNALLKLFSCEKNMFIKHMFMCLCWLRVNVFLSGIFTPTSWFGCLGSHIDGNWHRHNTKTTKPTDLYSAFDYCRNCVLFSGPSMTLNSTNKVKG